MVFSMTSFSTKTSFVCPMRCADDVAQRNGDSVRSVPGYQPYTTTSARTSLDGLPLHRRIPHLIDEEDVRRRGKVDAEGCG